MSKPPIFVADFETRNTPENIENEITSVWLWDVCTLGNYQHTTGETIETFFEHVANLAPCKIFFHNLKFDGSFILDYALKNGWNYNSKTKKIKTLISDRNVMYSISLRFYNTTQRKWRWVEFWDSNHKIPNSVEKIAKAWDLPILKGSIDYEAYRPDDYHANEKEIAYIHNDTEIIARVLDELFNVNLNKMTIASDTLALYKKHIGGERNFRTIFPAVENDVDEFIRASYRGGVCQVNERLAGKVLKNVYDYDVNSMYPFVMATKMLPYGVPKKFKGKYKPDELYPLYIIEIEADFELKPNYRPTILQKSFLATKQKYIRTTDGIMKKLVLTNVDFELFLKHYNIYDIKFNGGYKFKGSNALFKTFIMPLYKGKKTSKGAKKQLYKLLLNSFYGKFAMEPEHYSRSAILDVDRINFKLNDEIEQGDPVYTAVASFTTSYARAYLFECIQKNYNHFVYCDTDSIHLTAPAVDLWLDEHELGALKVEKQFITAKYVAQKCYAGYTQPDKLEITCAGAPEEVKQFFTLDNFEIGTTIDGAKLMPKLVCGGYVLVRAPFTIKPRL